MKKSEIIKSKLYVSDDIEGSKKSAYKKAERYLMQYSKKDLKDMEYIEVYFHYGWNCNVIKYRYKKACVYSLIEL